MTAAQDTGFQALQRRFAAHLRDPGRNPAPEGLEDRRVGIYRELFFNNVESLLAGNFPVIRRITPDARWNALVRDFLAGWRSHTPLFTEIGREFHRFLESRAGTGNGDPPFLPELAHYEWAELALSLDEASIDDVPHDPDGDVVDGIPVVSPLAWALAYRFPVQRIREDFQPDAPPAEPTFLLVVRNRRDEVAFLGVNALSLKLLEIVKENPGRTGLESLHALVEGLDPAAQGALVAAGADILRGFTARDVLLGTRAG
jgi:hypothetical protein